MDLTQATHLEAKEALQRTYPICRLLVFREKADEATSIEQEGKLFEKKRIRLVWCFNDSFTYYNFPQEPAYGVSNDF